MNQHKIDALIQQIKHKWGHSAILTASRLDVETTRLQTGFRSLDALLSGGLPRGQITEIVGQPTSALGTLVYYQMAASQSAGQNVVMVDQGRAFDGQSASRYGVRINDLVLVEEAREMVLLDVLRAIIRSQVVGLLVADLLSTTKRHLDLRVLLTDLRLSSCVLVLLLPPFAQTGTAALRLGVRRQDWLTRDGDIVGCLSEVTVLKNRYGHSGGSELLPLTLDQERWP